VRAFVHESFTAPPQIEIGPIGDWHGVTHINTDITMPLKSQSITWKSDGAEVQGWLLMPEKSDDKLPLITMVHGGPAGAWRPRFYGPGLLRGLLEHGAMLCSSPIRAAASARARSSPPPMCAIWGTVICATYWPASMR
jgi:hypothetical protein